MEPNIAIVCFNVYIRIITNLTLGSNHCFHYFCIVSSSFHDTYSFENSYHFSLKSLPFLQAGIIKFQLDKTKGKSKNVCIVSRTSVSIIVRINQIYYNQSDFTQHNIIITHLVLGYFNCIVQLQLSSRKANTEYDTSFILLRLKYIQHIGHTIFETNAVSLTMLPFNILGLVL